MNRKRLERIAEALEWRGPRSIDTMSDEELEAIIGIVGPTDEQLRRIVGQGADRRKVAKPCAER